MQIIPEIEDTGGKNTFPLGPFKLTLCHSFKHLECLSDSLFLPAYEYNFYQDYPTLSPAEEFDLTVGDWLYELLDTTGK